MVSEVGRSLTHAKRLCEFLTGFPPEQHIKVTTDNVDELAVENG